MDKIIIVTPDELETIIYGSLTKALQEQNNQQPGSLHDEKSYLDIEQAAPYLKMAVQTLYGYTSKKQIPYIKRGKNVLFLKADLDNWLMERRKQPAIITAATGGNHEEQ